ncbi:MAG: PxKF domain-containing protein [Vicinamibacterales bacterium]
MKFRVPAAFMLAAIVSAISVGAWGSFVATDLGALDDGSSYALDISESGVAVGYSGSHAFKWTQASGMADLGTLGGGSSIAWAINDQGTLAVGASRTAANTQHAFAWTEAAGMTDLGTLGGISPGSYATGVNNGALVVGFSWRRTSNDLSASSVTHGFAWTASTGMVDIGTFGGDTYPNAVNNNGLVVGTSYTEDNATSRPFAWTRADGLIDLGSLGGRFGEALAVSDSGVVVGYSYTAGDVSYPHPFAWTQESGMIDLGTLGTGNGGYATAVNDDGVVVGYTSSAGSNAIRAFVWSFPNGMVDLDPVDTRESYATGISNDGLVVGNHLVDDSRGLYGFAWTPAGGMADLDPLGAPYSQIDKVTKSGIVLGFSWGPGGAGHATVWRAPDTTAPTARPTQTPAPNSAGWNVGSVTVSWNWTDNRGWGVDFAHCTTESTSSGTGSVALTASCTDLAGNTATALYTVRIDPTTPSVPILAPVNGGSYFLNAISTTALGNKTTDNLPALNSVEAGSTVSVTLSLVGNQGLDILALGYPRSQQVSCDGRAPLDNIEQTAGNSRLSDDPGSDKYNYLWETDKNWAGTCRRLTVRLIDGIEHKADFKLD